MSEQSPKIHTAMIAIMRKVRAVGKDRKNVQQGYQFRGIDEVYNHLHDIMAEAGVYMVMRVLDRSDAERETKSGSVMYHVVEKLEFDVRADDGSFVTLGPIFSEGMDTGDKATNKCMSVGQKYALLTSFLIPTKEMMEEADSTTPEPSRRMENAVPPERKTEKKAEKKASEALPETYLPTNPIPAGILLAIKPLHHLKDTPLTVMVLEDLELVREKLLAALERWVNDNRVSQHAIEISQQIVSASEMLIDKRKAESDGKA